MITNINAFILSGGKSSRMNKNKSFLKIGSTSVIERVIKTLQESFNNVSIITNEPEKYKNFELALFKDIYPNMGPVAGIHSALSNSTSDINFVVSCDMPLITSGVVDFLYQNLEKDKITLPFDANGEYPLCAFYPKAVAEIAEKLLEKSSNLKNNSSKNGVRLFDLIKSVPTSKVDIRMSQNYNDNLFMNMNDLDDYKKILTILNEEKNS